MNRLNVKLVANALRHQFNYPYSPYMLKHKCIFIHVPKTGGTSIRKVLGGSTVGRQHLPWTVFHEANRKKFHDSLKFGFVRDPVARTLSSYQYLKAGGNGKGDAEAAKAISEFDSFGDFVSRGLLNGAFKNHVMFFSQSYFLCDWQGVAKVDFLGRMETFEADCSRLLGMLGVAAEVDNHNQTSQPAGGVEVSEEAVATIREIYRDDFINFSY